MKFESYGIKKHIKEMELAVVFALSIIAMICMQGFKLNVFNVDDNSMQFYPIIQKCFETLIETGHLPIYDFCEMQGMIVADQGYYGQMNILMFASFIINRFLFGKCNTLSIYIILCVAIGNIGYDITFIDMHVSRTVRWMCISMLMGCSAFFSFGYWYYIWNNYLIIPYIILITYKIISDSLKGWCSYVALGFLLFFSLTLGNVQYTFYHYLIVGIIALISSLLSKDWKKIYVFMCNDIVAVILSAPILCMLIGASKRRELYVEGNAFSSAPVSLIRILVGSVIPRPIIEKFCSEWYWSYYIEGSFSDCGYDFLYSGFFLPLLFVFVIFIVCNGRYLWGYSFLYPIYAWA